MQRLVHLSHLSCIRHHARVSLRGVIEQNERGVGAQGEMAGEKNSENERRNEKQGGVKSGHSRREK